MRGHELKSIPIECLKPGKYQTRRVFDSQALSELAESIKAEGLIQPIVVRPINRNDVDSDSDEGYEFKEYEIVAGERRWRASQIAGLETILCIVRDYSDEQVSAITPIENIQRENLNPIEEAEAYQQIIDDFDYLHEEVAAVVGKSRVKITNLLRLLKLDKRVQQLLIGGDLSEGHGKVIAGLPEPRQYAFALESISKNWTTRRIEEEARRLQTNAFVEYKKDADILELERKISEQLGTEVKVDVEFGGQSGWVKIKYFKSANGEILAGILDKLGIDYDEK